MGKDDYGSDKTNEVIMYWTTDAGFDVDISEFVRSENEEKTKNGWKSYFHTATVTFKDYSWELKTSHFNLNLLADEIKQHLIDIKHPEFAYRIDHHNPLTQKYFEELSPRFGYDVKREETVYNPVKNEYTTRYQMVEKDNQWRYYDVFYTHKGDIEDYKEGSIFEFIKSKCVKDLYRADYKHQGLGKRFERAVKKYLATNRIEIKDTLYYVSNNHFIQSIKVGTVERKFYCEDNKKVEFSEIKKFFIEEAPEYVI